MGEQEAALTAASSGEAENAREPDDSEGVVLVVSNRRSGLHSDAVKRSRASLDTSFARVMSMGVDVLRDIAPEEEDARRVVEVKCDVNEITRKLKELPPDVIVEVFQPRFLQTTSSPEVRLLDVGVGLKPDPPGTGASLHLKVMVGSNPAERATVKVYLLSKTVAQKITMSTATADDKGIAQADYDPNAWTVLAAYIEPAYGAWPILLKTVTDFQDVSLPPLQMNGPLGWWASLTGALSYSPDNGKGIRIGVVDTGAGPHPYLDHVQRIGSFSRGTMDADPATALDVGHHGTHVSGIIAARPTGERDYGGIAAGAEVFVARAFPGKDKSAGQGDTARAIETLATKNEADLINLSFGGGPSAIEADAIQVALEHGAFCLAAAGNENGAPILFPAALANVVAISAIGIPGVIPPQSVDAMNQPKDLDKWSPWGIYLASFSNVGAQMAATAPGDGVVSTVPVLPSAPQAYLPLSGTSMSCPVATATLAVMLSKIAPYKNLARNAQRAQFARQMLQATLVNLGMAQPYQGSGLVRQV